MKGLTEKQRRILNYIEEFMNSVGMAPTVYEIADHFAIKTSTVFAHLRALQKKDFLSRSSKARSIALLKPHRKPRHPSGLRAIPVFDDLGNDRSIYNGTHKALYCDSSLFEKALHSDCRTLYALRVHGSGMAARGILDGDIAIVKRHPDELKKGDIIVAQENGCSTLKSCLGCSGGRLSFADGASENVSECSLKEFPLRGIVVGVQRAL